ncbi:MAG TPA: VTT domain-containing protein, partial [Stellaceae bacterium]|nr:VTT domain-containing protein [Stellaceae bacterium]
MTPQAAPAPFSRLRLAGRIIILVLIVAGMAVVLANRSVLDPAAIKTAIGGAPLAPLVFVAAHIVASLIFVPRTLLAVAAGLLWGPVVGFLWATVGSTLGAIAGFLLARYVNSGLVDPESVPRLGPLLIKAEAGGWRAVALVRLIPVIPHPVTNYGLGLTRLSLASYTLGTLVGQIPMTLAYVEFGTAGDHMLSKGANWIVP